jgi:16S rRNA processing protein RimM
VAAQKSPVVVVGRIQAPYGIKGWVHVASFTDPKDNILTYRPWLLRRGDQGVWHEAEVDEVRNHKQGFVARFRSIEDRTAAELVKGRWIGVPESEFPAAEGDEYYWRDLIDLVVVDLSGQTIGRVAGLMETGAHDVLVVADDTGDETLIPFHRQYVREVDRASGQIRVDWQAD